MFTRIRIGMPWFLSVTLLAAIVTPAPLRAAGPMKAMVPLSHFNAPTNLHTTNSLDECKQHAPGFGAIACAAAMQNRWYILVWDWSSVPCPPSTTCPANIDGYHIYSTGRGAPQLFGTVQGANYTAQAFDPNNGPPSGCVEVTAFAGSVDGDLSAQLCLTSSQRSTPKVIGNQTKRFLPQHLRSYGTGTGVDETFQLNVGTFSGPGYLDPGVRGAIVFDLSSFSGNVRGAVLNLSVLRTQFGTGSGALTNTYTNCIAYVYSGAGDWWDDSGTILPGTLLMRLQRSAGPTLALDVTKAVQQWLGGSNFGFVFGGDSAADPCYTTYGSISLDVTYY
jgi:hypothetical protein